MDFIFEIDTKGALDGDPASQQNEPEKSTTSTGSILSKFKELKQSLEAKYSANLQPEPTLKQKKSIVTEKNKNRLLSKEVLKELAEDEEPVWKKKRKQKELKKKNMKLEPKLAKTAEEMAKEEAKRVLQKSIVLHPDFEKLKAVPSYDVSKRQQLKERKIEKEKTKGKNWFNLPATEMTEDVKRDLEILQMRSVLDPKHFYKKNDLKTLPKYFQIGKVEDSPVDFYSGRLTKKERKKTLVDELLADAEFQKYNKRKYKEIINEKQKTHYKAWKQAKRLKKRK